MKVIRLKSEKEVPKHTGLYTFITVSMDDAKDMMKRNHPGLEPHTVLCLPCTEKITKYMFMTEPDTVNPAKQVRER